MSQVDDIKVRIIETIYEDGEVLDISSATAKSIIIRKTDGTILTYTAEFLTDGTDGKIYYDTIDGDLDQTGTYKVQAEISINGGTYRGSVSSFTLKCNLD